MTSKPIHTSLAIGSVDVRAASRERYPPDACVYGYFVILVFYTHILLQRVIIAIIMTNIHMLIIVQEHSSIFTQTARRFVTSKALGSANIL
jgi:hypothetical protein